MSRGRERYSHAVMSGHCPCCGIRVEVDPAPLAMSGRPLCEPCYDSLHQNQWVCVEHGNRDYIGVLDQSSLRLLRVSSDWLEVFLVTWGCDQPQAVRMLSETAGQQLKGTGWAGYPGQ